MVEILQEEEIAEEKSNCFLSSCFLNCSKFFNRFRSIIFQHGVQSSTDIDLIRAEFSSTFHFPLSSSSVIIIKGTIRTIHLLTAFNSSIKRSSLFNFFILHHFMEDLKLNEVLTKRNELSEGADFISKVCFSLRSKCVKIFQLP